METNFSYKASSSTDAELMERITNRKSYLPETVEASLAELQNRKHEFSDEQIIEIIDDVDLQRKNATMVDSRLGLFNNNGKKVFIKDHEAPLMYSRQALYGFTVFCGALFGSIMLAINMINIGKAMNALWVVLFGIAFTAAQIYIISTFGNEGSGGSGAYLGGFIAAYIFDYFFWRPFIGYSTFYRAKPIWIPLIIAVFVIGLIVAGIIYGKQ